MVRAFLLFAIILVALFTGCNTVVLKGPIGRPLTTEEKSAFVGRWISQDEEQEVCQLNLAKNGELVAGFFGWDEETQQFGAQTWPIDARRVGRAVYFLVLMEDGDDRVYEIFRIEQTSENELKLIFADPKKFREAVEKRKLKGKVTFRLPKTKGGHFTVSIDPSSKGIEEVFGVDDFAPWTKEDGEVTWRLLNRPK